jgi:hypothetical protein
LVVQKPQILAAGKAKKPDLAECAFGAHEQREGFFNAARRQIDAV